jgi:hypothetical protein
MFSVSRLVVSFYEKEARSNICYFFWAAHCQELFLWGREYPDELIAYQDNNAKKSIHRLYWAYSFPHAELAALLSKRP